MRLLNENHYSNEYLFISFMQLYVRLYFHDYSFEDHLSLKARTKRSSQKKKKEVQIYFGKFQWKQLRWKIFHVNKFIPSSKNYIMKEAKYVKIQTEKFCCLYANVRQFSNTLIVPMFILKMLDWWVVCSLPIYDNLDTYWRKS